MKPELVTFETREKYLFIKGRGTRDGWQAIMDASSAIYQRVVETNSRYLLVDYTDVDVRLPASQAFNVITRYEALMPQLKSVIVACVFNEASRDFGDYWKEIGTKRGFSINLFDQLSEAEAWLLALIEKSK